jgi:asparagine synthase (glutamine-hydrolysing)
MCGLVGIFDPAGERPVDLATLRAMTQALRHRGPDGQGEFVGPGIGIGHRRLAVIDRPGGEQPMLLPERDLALAYNGEIYNFVELRDELRGRGHAFRTRSDTEVLLRAWAEWGRDCVERLRGMFAFALWDGRARRLFLVRDRLGIKPLYYGRVPDGRWLFASELKGILRCPEFPRAIDPCAVEDFLAFGFVPDPRTIYADAWKLPPGHVLELAAGAADLLGYWDVTFAPGRRGSLEQAAAELNERLDEAVDLRRVADVPLGAFLSGGLDSSAVVASLSRGLSPDALRTCSIGFDRPAFDESAHALRVAAHCGARHRTRQVALEDLDLLDVLPAVFDEPFADDSALPTYRLCQLAREEVTVALSGDGGDELFAGYRRHRWHMREEVVRRLAGGSAGAPVFAALARLYPKLDWAPRPLRAKATLEALALDACHAYALGLMAVRPSLRHRLLSADMRAALRGYDASEALRPAWNAGTGLPPLERALYVDLKTYLPGDILTKVDRASMAHGLEVRVPFLDHRFVEWAATLPADARLARGQDKRVLRQALAGRVPDAIRRRPKIGFSLPLSAWLRDGLGVRLEETLRGPVFSESGLFDRNAALDLLARHRTGRWDFGRPLWALSAFAGFLERVHARPVAAATLSPAVG